MRVRARGLKRIGLSGVAAVLASALLFGLSAPLAKTMLGEVSPWMLAGLLYLGSGLGLSLAMLARNFARKGTAPRVVWLRGRGWLYLGGAVGIGGIAGPILLMYGLQQCSASVASLMLNLEGVFTSLLAWLLFHEHLGRRVPIGTAAILAGGVLLSWSGQTEGGGVAGALLVAGACLAWAVDNNLTSKISGSDPLLLAAAKGLVAGSMNTVLALLSGARLPEVNGVASIAAVGVLGYGGSLVLFIIALRQLGAARTGAYFGVAPFIGAAFAITAMGEPLKWPVLIAALLMLTGVSALFGERHDHQHVHEPMTHGGIHVHDAHHAHVHGEADPGGEPHAHVHTHEPIAHSHPHCPDIHHRHGHEPGH